MISPKKALGSYILVLLAFSLVITVLLMVVIEFTFTNKHEFCEEIDFEVNLRCEARLGYEVTMINTQGLRDVYYEVDGELDSLIQFVQAGNSSTKIFDVESDLKFVPYVKGEDEKLYSCVERTITLPKRGVPKC